MDRISQTNLLATPSASGGADCCPLCGGPNACQLCTSAAYKGPCWCASVNIPNELIARVPMESRRRACICRDCLTSFHRERLVNHPTSVLRDDFYFEHGLMVFTAAYLRRRGYCCGNECRHCPYREARP